MSFKTLILITILIFADQKLTLENNLLQKAFDSHFNGGCPKARLDIQAPSNLFLFVLF